MGKMADYLAEQLGLMREKFGTRTDYLTQQSCMYISMFAWNAPDFYDPEWAERYLIYNGNFVGGFLPGGKPAIAPNVSRTGTLDIYGDGTQANAPCRGTAGTIRGEIGKDAFICYNNPQRMPETELIYYPDQLALIDRTVMMLTNYAKYPPIICAANSITEKTINTILDDADNGKPRAITDENVLRSLTRNGLQDVYSMDIADPHKLQLIQYLLEAHDVITRRIYAKNGIDTRRTSKHAQVSVDEADGMQLASWVYPLARLRCRQKFAEGWTARYPEYPISVEFAEPWASAYQEFLAEQEMVEDQTEGGNDDGNDNNTGASGTGDDG